MRKKSYTQLTPEKRYQIYTFLGAGRSQSAIASELGVHKATISRELKRNRGQRGYRPRQAQQRADARAQERASRPRIRPATWQWVRQKLCEQWSPEQIAGRLRHQTSQSCGRVSHKRIYQFIYEDKKVGGTLHTQLRSQKKRRKRYGSGRSRHGQIAGRVCISQRPEIVERRERIGGRPLGRGGRYHCGQRTSTGHCLSGRARLALHLAAKSGAQNCFCGGQCHD